MSKSYSFLDVNVGLVGPGGALSLGAGAAAAEEGITFTPVGPINGMMIGADGSGQHNLYADRSGKITVRLLKNSPVNQQLSLMFNFQRSAGVNHGQNTIALNDSSRGDVITCTGVAFSKVPDLNYGKDGAPLEWEFDAIAMNFSLGS